MLDAFGKLYLDATLFNDIGQIIAKAKYPFYILENGIIASFSTEKSIYKSGETVNITGEVQNTTPSDQQGIMVEVAVIFQGSSQMLYTATVDIPFHSRQALRRHLKVIMQ